MRRWRWTCTWTRPAARRTRPASSAKRCASISPAAQRARSAICASCFAAGEAIGLPFLGASVAGGDLAARMLDIRPLADVLRESLVIGGWVAMWRPMEIFLYDWWPIRNERRLFDRLSAMEVRVVAASSSDVAHPAAHAGVSRS